jgi:hypothetical protein
MTELPPIPPDIKTLQRHTEEISSRIGIDLEVLETDHKKLVCYAESPEDQHKLEEVPTYRLIRKPAKPREGEEQIQAFDQITFGLRTFDEMLIILWSIETLLNMMIDEDEEKAKEKKK